MEKIFLENPWIFIVIFIWTLPWKGVALWVAARRGHIGWFLALLILNTLAILDILYIFIFSKWGTVKKDKEEQKSSVDKDQQETPTVRQPRFSVKAKTRSTII